MFSLIEDYTAKKKNSHGDVDVLFLFSLAWCSPRGAEILGFIHPEEDRRNMYSTCVQLPWDKILVCRLQIRADNIRSPLRWSHLSIYLSIIDLSIYRSVLPVLVLPDAEPFDQVLGALQFGVKTVFLPFESRHILHRHAIREKIRAQKEESLTKHKWCYIWQ